MAAVTMTPAKQAYDEVLKMAGATLPHRDRGWMNGWSMWSKPARSGAKAGNFTPEPMKGLAKNNYGKAGNGIITDMSQIGGYPEYKGEPVRTWVPTAFCFHGRKNSVWMRVMRRLPRNLQA